MRTIIDGTTDIRESPDWIVLSVAGRRRVSTRTHLIGLIGKPVAAWVLHLLCGNNADIAAREVLSQHFVKTSIKSRPAQK